MKHGPVGLMADDAFIEEDVVAKAAQLDGEAFGLLYHRYMERVYRYLRVYIPTEEDAADLTQQVFFQAFKAIPTYKSQGVPFTSWLFRIARNLIIDAARKHRATLDWAHLPEALQPTSEIDPETTVLRMEALDRLGVLVAQLPQDKRELLALRFAARLTASEIATTLGKSEAAVQKQLERTIKTLRERYGETP